MNKYCALLVVVSLPLSARDFVLAGRLEGVTHTSISIRMADGRAVDAVLPAGIAVPYSAADQVEITCTPAKTVYDAQAALHFHLLMKSLRLVRTATPQERAEVMALLSWQPGENLLYRPEPVAPRSPFELERVRQVNLEYLSKMPNFVADETARRYESDSAEKPWRLYDTVEDEITFTGVLNSIARTSAGTASRFTALLANLADSVAGALASEWNSTPYLTSNVPPKSTSAGPTWPVALNCWYTCFAHPRKDVSFSTPWTAGTYNPARTGRFLVDAGRGNVVRYQEEAAGYPANFGLERTTVKQSWDYVKIGDATYLLPVSFEFVGRRSDGEATRVSVEYKNHRHFEAAASVTFGKDQ